MRSANSKTKRPSAPQSVMAAPPFKSEIVMLSGAGASQYFGLPDLNNILKNLAMGSDDPTVELIRQTKQSIEGQYHRISVAVFEEMIARLKYYLQITETLMSDFTFTGQLGATHPHVVTGVLARTWKNALSKCYRLLLEEYGPDKINFDRPEFKTTLELIGELAALNGGELHIYTTNYDCSYQVMASICDRLSFFSHIHNQKGTFQEAWYPSPPQVAGRRKPKIFVHRLHGCVAWYTQEEPYEIREVYGAGGGLEIIDEDLLHKMCIKLITAQEIGKNVAFLSAYEEFCNHLESARALLIWGSSFRDMEVLRAINNAFSIRRTPLPIYYINPYTSEAAAVDRIARTLRPVPVVVNKNFQPKQIKWQEPQPGDALIDAVVNAVRIKRRSRNAKDQTLRKSGKRKRR